MCKLLPTWRENFHEFWNGLLTNINSGLKEILALPAMNHICTREPCQDWWRLHSRLCQVCLVVPPETGENRSSFVFVLMRTRLSQLIQCPWLILFNKGPFLLFQLCSYTNSTDRVFYALTTTAVYTQWDIGLKKALPLIEMEIIYSHHLFRSLLSKRSDPFVGRGVATYQVYLQLVSSSLFTQWMTRFSPVRKVEFAKFFSHEFAIEKRDQNMKWFGNRPDHQLLMSVFYLYCLFINVWLGT